MTDNRTTELLDGLRNVGNLHEFAELFGFNWYDDSDWIWHDVAVKMADDIEQAITVTLGSESVDYMLNTIGKLEEENERLRSSCGTLTAEQVRRAIRKYAADDSCYIFEVYGEMCGLIADELNAELGSGTCEWVLEHSGTLYDKWRCSKCGYLFVESRTDQHKHPADFDPNFCPNCGKAVKR